MQSVMIPLNKGKVAFVDEEDAGKVNKQKWYAEFGSKTFYARNTKNRKWMHRVILNAQKGQMCDHINGNGLDNRKSNLRFCTYAQNRINCFLNKNNTSGFRGVYKLKRGRKIWKASIKFKGKHILIGFFHSKIDAAMAYDKKAVELFGEFARLNFPKTVVKGRIKNVIEASRGRIIKVAFRKRSSGAERIMLCRTGVHKGKNGRGLSFDPDKYGIVIVYDMQKKMYRAVPLDGVKAIWINHNKFKVA